MMAPASAHGGIAAVAVLAVVAPQSVVLPRPTSHYPLLTIHHSRPTTHYPLPTTLSDTTIVLRATSSALEFQPPAISARQGTLVRLRFINAGTLPHNVVLVRDENDIDQLAVAAYQAAATGYVPLESRDKLIAYSTLASPGDTVEVTFTAPPPGVYRYVCLFPGHANSMWGTFRSLR
jgi:plastocyanin